MTALAAFVRKLANDRRIRYLAVAGLGAGLYFGFFSAGWLLLGDWIPYLAMAVIANVLAALVVYPLNRVLVFQSDVPWIAGFLRFYSVWLVNVLFGLIALPALVELAHLPVLVSLLMVLVVQPIVNYNVLKLWAFRRRRQPATQPAEHQG